VSIEIDSPPMDNKSEVASQQPNEKRTRGRGYSRGPGRGRGRGFRGTRALPTIEQRIDRIRELKSVEETSPNPNAPTIEKLSAMMENMYPASSQVNVPHQDVLIDVHGYCNIVERTYKTLIDENRKLADLLSYDEFCLVMGWSLARRVLSVRQATYQGMGTSDSFFKNLSVDTEIPGPIATCLETLGLVRSQSGVVMVPDIILPRSDVDQEWQRGLLPSRSRTSFMSTTVAEAWPSMYPFWFYKRRLKYFHGNGDDYKQDWYRRLDPTDDDEKKVLDWMDERHLIPGMRNLGVLESKVKRDSDELVFSETQDTLGSVAYSGTIYGSYLSFVRHAKKHMIFKKVKRESNGTGALLGWVEHDDHPDMTSEYRCFSSYLMPPSDMMGVRLFKWRRKVPRIYDPFDGVGVDYSWGLHPEELKRRNREISKVNCDVVLIHSYVSKFIVDKNM